jgi:hypothetical protein
VINSLLSQVQQASAQALQNNVPNDVITANGPRPQQALVPFWDLPLTTYELSNNAFNPWDTVILGGLWLPGLGKVLVKTRKRFDVKKKKGSDGAGLTFTGYDPSDVNITLRVWTPIHLDTLQSLMPMLKAKSTTAAGAQATAAELALDISHPALALIAIHSVVVVGVSGLVDVEPKGVKQMEIACLEYVPPAKGDNSATTKKSQNFTNSTAINVPAAAKELPSKDSNFTGPEGH